MVEESRNVDGLFQSDPSTPAFRRGCLRKSCIGCITVLLVCGLAGYLVLRPQPLLTLVSSEDREVIESPDRLDIVRIDPLQSPFTLEKPGGVLANTKAKLPPVIATKALKDATVFAFRNTEFDRGFSPKCSPEPGILFRFTRKRRTVESAFCAMCGAVFFYRSGEKKSVMQYVDRKPFLGVARIAFPKDEALSGGTD